MHLRVKHTPAADTPSKLTGGNYMLTALQSQQSEGGCLNTARKNYTSQHLSLVSPIIKFKLKRRFTHLRRQSTTSKKKKRSQLSVSALNVKAREEGKRGVLLVTKLRQRRRKNGRGFKCRVQQ